MELEYLIYIGLGLVGISWVYGMANGLAFLPRACIGYSIGFWMIAAGFVYAAPFDTEWANWVLGGFAALMGLGAWIEFKKQTGRE